MKNFIIVFVIFFLFGCPFLRAEKKLEIDQRGNYRLEERDNWVLTDIKVDDSAKAYLAFFKVVIDHPGKPVVVKEKKKIIKLRPIFQALVKKEIYSIVFKDNRVTFQSSSVITENDEYLIMLWVLSMMFMVIATRSYYKIIIAVSAIFSIIVTIFDGVVAIALFNAVGSGSLAIFAGILALVAHTYDNSTKLFSNLYYGFMCISIIFLYLSI